MKYNPDKHHRRTIRLKDYDYSQPGWYFVTVCAQNREMLFGDVVDGKMVLNDTGQMVQETWEWLATQYPYVELDTSVIMPNHLHGIVVIVDDCRGDLGKGGSRTAPTTQPTKTAKRKPIGRLIGTFKTVTTKQINELNNPPGAKLWQHNYYEHIIRDEPELNRIRQYIIENPLKWKDDKYNLNQHKPEKSDSYEN